MDGSGILGSLKAKASSKVKGAKDKAASAALMGSLSKMNPFKKGLPSVSSLTKSMPKGLTGPTVPGQPSKLSTAFKIVVFAIASLFISLFAIFSFKKSQGFSTENILKIVFVALIFNAGLFGAFMLKLPVLDFLISSEINILCFYMILTFTTITSLFSDGVWEAIKTSFGFIKDITTDPTSMFENSGKTFIPIFFFIIPSVVLLYNASQGFTQFLLILAMTLGTGAVILLPKFY
jgi:hypothetical protein